ncbi:unnamed protein product [Mycena citricolor]|uniref:Uncharacterized protein n=1 Tax=Mycena citricolor TaxID=2018698 RepID=A0AAD2K8D2_9AGAR|nr:unnamed protein product [Mycena citricolor]CAK5284846.1 unnamed protein product [Mycena citricolor]
MMKQSSSSQKQLNPKQSSRAEKSNPSNEAIETKCKQSVRSLSVGVVFHDSPPQHITASVSDSIPSPSAPAPVRPSRSGCAPSGAAQIHTHAAFQPPARVASDQAPLVPARGESAGDRTRAAREYQPPADGRPGRPLRLRAACSSARRTLCAQGRRGWASASLPDSAWTCAGAGRRLRLQLLWMGSRWILGDRRSRRRASASTSYSGWTGRLQHPVSASASARRPLPSV